MSDETPPADQSAEIAQLRAQVSTLQEQNAAFREGGKYIPKDKFDAANERRKTAEADLEKAKADLIDITKQAVYHQQHAEGRDAAEAQVRDLNARLEEQAAQFGTDAVLLGAGIEDDPIRKVIRDQYAEAVKEAGDKAPDFGEWFSEYRKAPPRFVQPYLTADGAQPPKTPPKPEARTVPGNDTATPPTPPSSGPLTMEGLRDMSLEDIRAGKLGK
ncbi:hypothetical protein H8E07_15080 [bacterium]|nr:hypothetical protein [bacterium]